MHAVNSYLSYLVNFSCQALYMQNLLCQLEDLGGRHVNVDFRITNMSYEGVSRAHVC